MIAGIQIRETSVVPTSEQTSVLFLSGRMHVHQCVSSTEQNLEEND